MNINLEATVSTEALKGFLVGFIVVLYCYIFFSGPRILKVNIIMPIVPASEDMQDAPTIQ